MSSCRILQCFSTCCLSCAGEQLQNNFLLETSNDKACRSTCLASCRMPKASASAWESGHGGCVSSPSTLWALAAVAGSPVCPWPPVRMSATSLQTSAQAIACDVARILVDLVSATEDDECGLLHVLDWTWHASSSSSSERMMLMVREVFDTCSKGYQL